MADPIQGAWEYGKGAAGYGNVGEQRVVHTVAGEEISQRVKSEDWQGKNSYEWIYKGNQYPTLEAAKQALSEATKQNYSQYSTVDFSNLRNDPNWRETLLNHSIFVAGLGNLTDEDIENMKAKFADYEIEDIIDVEAEQLTEDVYKLAGERYGLAGETREQALVGADIQRETMLGGLQEQAGAVGAPGVGMRSKMGGMGKIEKGFETGYDVYGLKKEGAETAYKGAGLTYEAADITRRSAQEGAETGYETTLQSQLNYMFPDIFLKQS